MNLYLIPQAPAKADRAARWEQIAKGLRSYPGEWFEVYVTRSIKSAANVALSIRGGGYHSVMPESVFQATARKADTHYVVSARYVGELPPSS